MKLYLVSWVFILTVAFLSSFSFAQSIDIGDCRKDLPIAVFEGNTYREYINIFPRELLVIAQKNLANFCYDKRREFTNRKTTDVYVKDNRTKDYPLSPWLVDHIIDVGMRRLDGREEYIYGGMSMDPQWVAWIEKSEKFANNIIGGIPAVLQNDFTTHRGTVNHISTQVISQTCQDSRTRFAEYNTQRSELPLWQKYIILCEWATCLANGKKDIQSGDFLPRCLSMANIRIWQEQAYVQWLLSLQGTQAIKSSIEWYVHTSFTRKNFHRLFDKIVKMVKDFAHINDKVPELTRQCSA